MTAFAKFDPVAYLQGLKKPAVKSAPPAKAAKVAKVPENRARTPSRGVAPEQAAQGDDPAIARWLRNHPPKIEDQDRCPACGGFLIGDIMPLAERDELGRVVWVHYGEIEGNDCLLDYQAARRRMALQAQERITNDQV